MYPPDTVFEGHFNLAKTSGDPVLNYITLLIALLFLYRSSSVAVVLSSSCLGTDVFFVI